MLIEILVGDLKLVSGIFIIFFIVSYWYAQIFVLMLCTNLYSTKMI